MRDGCLPAFERFARMGAILEIARLPLAHGSAREAALEGMRVFAERSGGLVRISRDVESGERKLAGKQITLQDLFGPGYDVETDTIHLIRYGDRVRANACSRGLAYALLNPPYGIRPADGRDLRPPGVSSDAAWHPLWLRDVLRAFCAEVLELPSPKDAAHLRIHRWPTDWSTFFDAGAEWWGTFYWTIEDTRHQWTSVIGASSTD